MKSVQLSKLKTKIEFLIVLFMIALVGCKKEPKYLQEHYSVVDKSRHAYRAFIPAELKAKLLEGIAPLPAPAAAHGKEEHGKEEHGKEEHGKEEHGKEEHKEEKKEHAEEGAHGEHKEGEPVKTLSEVGPEGFAPMQLQVYLIEKTQGILGHRNYKIQYGPGGGKLDLSEFVQDKIKGTFYFVIEPDPQEEGDVSVWHLSNSKVRRLGDEDIGGGCKSFYDITDYVKKEMKDLGFAVNTTEQRYVSALAGQYLIKIKKEGRTAIGSLEVTDSRYPEKLCR